MLAVWWRKVVSSSHPTHKFHRNSGMNTTHTPKLTVFYDGACPLCLFEMRHLMRLNTAGKLAFEDITATPAIVLRLGLFPGQRGDREDRGLHI